VLNYTCQVALFNPDEAAQASLADILFDETICADATIRTLTLDGLRLLIELPLNQTNRLNFIKPVNPLRIEVAPLGATTGLPAVQIV